MSMQPLTSATPLPAGVLSPGFDRQQLKPGIVHLGFGAFHRAHQAVYTDLALAEEFGDWGIIGVSLRSRQAVEDLRRQDHLFTVTARDADGPQMRLVGCVIGGISAADEREALLARLKSPETRIVTLTVTEKAYGLDPVTGGLDLAHPAIAADLAHPQAPIGAIGFLVEGLARRRAAGIAPYTVLCCDNLPTNGRVVRRLVLDMATRRDPALADWIAAEGAFPCTMVDRIVPAATADTLSRAAELLGAEDRLALDTEPFLQWVIEDHFACGRPAWEKAGALFVETVEPYEKMKLRLLNGAHSMLAYLGQVKGLAYVRDVMAVPEHAVRVRRHMAAAARTLDPVPGIDLDAYQAELIARFSNPTIAHKTKQIAMDGSQKMPQRIFAGTVEALAQGDHAVEFAEATAFWIAYIRTTDLLEDPRADELRAAARLTAETGSPDAFFALPGLFPEALVQNAAWRERVAEALKAI